MWCMGTAKLIASTCLTYVDQSRLILTLEVLFAAETESE